MSVEHFEIVPPGKLVLLFPLFIGLFMPIAMVAALLLSGEAYEQWLALLPVLLLAPLVAGIAAWSMHTRTVRLVDAGLVVRRFPWSRAIPMREIALDQARIIDLEAHPELMPRFKLAGTRLPGYRVGLFLLRDKRRATVILTELRRVLVLPLRNGTVVLLSLARPDALLAALQRRSG